MRAARACRTCSKYLGASRFSLASEKMVTILSSSALTTMLSDMAACLFWASRPPPLVRDAAACQLRGARGRRTLALNATTPVKRALA